jgi:hypothetical protein
MGFMETTAVQVVQAADSEDDSVTAQVPSGVEELYRNRIRFDGYFTGPTW